MMKDYEQLYPGYGFAQNAGYGTKAHLEGLEKLGPTPIHRMTFCSGKRLSIKSKIELFLVNSIERLFREGVFL